MILKYNKIKYLPATWEMSFLLPMENRQTSKVKNGPFTAIRITNQDFINQFYQKKTTTNFKFY